ncbi:glycoside hydrolase [Jaminaea rosea]|uniref:Glycoside hydrolase n=1 Tax=Jaminaea rosea TaxID=1569628 RepID=A0A316UYB4_9BASI|nr:glycoside hydrolase [Jaminaea rosea]PWN29301.1 glycoside hydrolase [Jaminaea rosea]
MVPGPEIKVPSHFSTNTKTTTTAARIKRFGAKKAVKPLPGTANYVSNPRPPKGHLRPSTLGELPISINSNKDPRFVLYGDLYFQDDTFGVPPVNKVKGFTHYNVAFWMATSGPADNALAWTQATDEQRKKIKKAYNDAGIKLMVSAFGATDTPQTGAGLGNATKTANRLADFVRKYNFDGVDVDYEEMDHFAQGKSVPWLVTLTKQLRRRLPRDQGYLLTHAPIAPWFSKQIYKDGGYTEVHKQAGEDVDFYNVQFYNQGKDAYTSCDGLIWEGPKEWPSTSLFELAKYSHIPLDKLVIGKPALPTDAANGYVSKHDLGKCAQEAEKEGWKAGLMWWEYSKSFSAEQLKRVLFHWS